MICLQYTRIVCILAYMKSDVQRINITLPAATLKRIDRAAKPGKRSEAIDEAINYYLDKKNLKQLHKELKEGAIANAEQDRQITAEWFPLEQEVWDKLDQ